MRHTIAVVEAWVGPRKRIPSASLCVRVDGSERFHLTTGLARIDPPRLAAPDQAYDLASVSKALGAAPVVASLVEQGLFGFDDAVNRFLPDVDERVLVRHLLTHSSGLPWWRPLYERAIGAWGTTETRRTLWDLARRLPLEAAPGVRHSYSDMGMIVLHQLIDAVTGERLDVLHRLAVGVRDLRYGGWPGAAATEQCPVRGLMIEGTVHDLNTAALGGISTHAGLFGTARAVCGLADDLMHAVLAPDARPDLPGTALGAMWAMKGPGTHTGIWDSRSAEGYVSTGQYWPSDARGHLGYTGTSVWVAPSRRTSVAVLTNRVHPVDEKESIREFRPLIYDAIAKDLGWA